MAQTLPYGLYVARNYCLEPGLSARVSFAHLFIRLHSIRIPPTHPARRNRFSVSYESEVRTRVTELCAMRMQGSDGAPISLFTTTHAVHEPHSFEEAKDDPPVSFVVAITNSSDDHPIGSPPIG